MVFCSNCGAASQSGHYCSHCGAQLGSGGGHVYPSKHGGPKYIKKKCLGCNGTGSGWFTDKHGPCDGKGVVLVRDPPTICGHCNGTGAGMGATTNCSVCGGIGWLNSKRLG